jgi:hypothetical protein
MPNGVVPTVMLFISLFVEPSITATEFEPRLVTQNSPFCELKAIA